MDSSAHSPIPFDLFVSKKHPGLTHGDLGFADASGNVIFKINRRSSKSSPNHNKRLLLDSAGNPLLSIYRYHVSPSLFVWLSDLEWNNSMGFDWYKYNRCCCRMGCGKASRGMTMRSSSVYLEFRERWTSWPELS